MSTNFHDELDSHIAESLRQDSGFVAAWEAQIRRKFAHEIEAALREQQEWLRSEIITDDGFAASVGHSVIDAVRETLAGFLE